MAIFLGFGIHLSDIRRKLLSDQDCIVEWVTLFKAVSKSSKVFSLFFSDFLYQFEPCTRRFVNFIRCERIHDRKKFEGGSDFFY